MVWLTIIILLIFWLLGYIGQVAEGFIHLLLFAALIVFIYHWITRRRAV
jgi:Family of unknown function (DUF5670)